VLKQTFQDWELLIVDDCSNDGTGSLIESYKDDRIYYFRHEQNRGAPAARNTGLNHARGELVAFLDSDNEWLPERLQKQVELFSRVNENVGIIYANNKVIDEVNQKEYIWAFGLRGNLYREFLQRPFMDFITPLIRRSCFDKIGLMDEKCPSYQEWDTFLRLSRYYEFDFVDEILAIYYIHKQIRVSKGPLQEAAGWKYVFEKHKPEMLEQFSPRVFIEHHKNLARYYQQGHSYVRWLKHTLQAYYYKTFFK